MKNKTTPKKEPNNVTTFTMRINRGIKRALEKAAREDRRSLASLIEKIGVDYLNAHKIAWSEDDCLDSHIKLG